MWINNNELEDLEENKIFELLLEEEDLESLG